MNNETLEEAAKKQWGNVHRVGVLAFQEGAKWQAERMYSEEDMELFAEWLIKINFNYTSNTKDALLTWKSEFKNK